MLPRTYAKCIDGQGAERCFEDALRDTDDIPDPANVTENETVDESGADVDRSGRPMQLIELLWDPLPDPLPTHRSRFPRLSQLAAAVTANAPSLSAQELVNRRVRRGAVQALVQKAYLDTVAEQDDEQRGPAAFAEAWHDCLAEMLAQASVDLPGWATVTVADLDIDLAWRCTR